MENTGEKMGKYGKKLGEIWENTGKNGANKNGSELIFDIWWDFQEGVV